MFNSRRFWVLLSPSRLIFLSSRRELESQKRVGGWALVGGWGDSRSLPSSIGVIFAPYPMTPSSWTACAAADDGGASSSPSPSPYSPAPPQKSAESYLSDAMDLLDPLPPSVRGGRELTARDVRRAYDMLLSAAEATDGVAGDDDASRYSERGAGGSFGSVFYAPTPIAAVAADVYRALLLSARLLTEMDGRGGKMREGGREEGGAETAGRVPISRDEEDARDVMRITERRCRLILRSPRLARRGKGRDGIRRGPPTLPPSRYSLLNECFDTTEGGGRGRTRVGRCAGGAHIPPRRPRTRRGRRRGRRRRGAGRSGRGSRGARGVSLLGPIPRRRRRPPRRRRRRGETASDGFGGRRTGGTPRRLPTLGRETPRA